MKTNSRQKIVLAALSVCLCCVLMAGCTARAAYGPITDVHDLEGRRVGVGLAWSQDYILEDREDMELARYIALDKMVLGLRSGHVDAIALDKASADYVCAAIPAFRMVEEPTAYDEIIVFFNAGNDGLREQFNAFTAEFRETEEYADIFRRVLEMEDGVFESREAASTQGADAPVIRMVCEQNYPYTYINFETGEVEGADVEIARHFADWAGYRLDTQLMEYEAAVMQMVTDQADMLMGAMSSAYRGEVEASGLALGSEPYGRLDIHFIEVGDPALFEGVSNDFY